jgi:hypothetical protein
MTIRLFIVLACTFLAVSACVVEPCCRGGGYYGGGREYGRPVWRG